MTAPRQASGPMAGSAAATRVAGHAANALAPALRMHAPCVLHPDAGGSAAVMLPGCQLKGGAYELRVRKGDVLKRIVRWWLDRVTARFRRTVCPSPGESIAGVRRGPAVGIGSRIWTERDVVAFFRGNVVPILASSGRPGRKGSRSRLRPVAVAAERILL